MEYSVLPESNIFLELDVPDKKALLEFLSKHLWEQGFIKSQERFLEAVYLRESEGETGIELGLAIPHGKTEAVLQTVLCFARLSRPIEWETLDGNPVSIVVLFAVSDDVESTNTRYIKLLAEVAGNLVKDGVIDQLKTVRKKQGIVNLLLNK